MDEDSPNPKSPPLPKKGVYNFDFDALDEFSNPFESKDKMQMGSSPPIQSSSSHQFDESVDPFQSKKALANSPPGSPKLTPAPSREDRFEADIDDKSTEGSEKPPQSTSDESKTSSQVTPKKKKVIKKPQVQSKFKPPKNLKKHQNNTDDIEIIMPGVDPDNNNQPTSRIESVDKEEFQTREENHLPNPPPVDKVGDTQSEHLSGNVDEEGPPPQDAAPDAMAMSTEIDRHFIDADDEPELRSGGISSSHEEFKDARDWSTPNQATRSGISEPSDRAAKETPVSRVGSDHKKSKDENVEVSPTVSESSKDKHPALRALQSDQGDGQVVVGKSANPAMDKNGADQNESKGQVVQFVQVLRYSQTDWNKMKQELELNFQTSLLNKERDWSRLLADRDKKISSLEDTNKKLKSTNEDMRAVVTEFEKTIAQLQSDKEKLKTDSNKSVQDLEGERNQALEDLASVESAFSDLHRRYEKSKTIVEGFKRNEEQLKECLEDLKLKLKKSESKLTALRSQAEEKLDRANEDIEKIKKSTKSDVARLEASLKKSELRISSLDEALTRKEKENQELTAICDELIAKVGS